MIRKRFRSWLTRRPTAAGADVARVTLSVEQTQELQERSLELGVPIDQLIGQAVNVFLGASATPPPAGSVERLVRGVRRLQWRLDAGIMKISVAPAVAQKELTGIANEISELIEAEGD